MKVFKQIGSKERFLEVFQNVNKVKLNEAFGQGLNPQSVLNVAFNDLKSGVLGVEQSKTQANNNESYVELICIDKEGNNITFTFKAQVQEGDQEGVFDITDIGLETFSFDSARGDEEAVELSGDVLKQFNMQHKNEMLGIVDKYIDVEEEETIDSLYEDAVRKIDSVPFKGGSERMQTHKAYADEKPTNSDVRVSAEELGKFVNEIADLGQLPAGVNPRQQEILNTIYDKIQQKTGKAPTFEEIKAELQMMLAAMSAQRGDSLSEGEEKSKEKKEYPQPLGKEFKPESQSEYLKKIGKKKPKSKKIKIKESYEVVDSDFNREFYGDMIGQILDSPPAYAQVKKVEEPADSDIGHADYLKQSGQMKSFDIKEEELPKEPEFPEEPEEFRKMGVDGQDDSGMTLEPAGDEIEQIAQEKEQVGDLLQGGKAENKSPLEYDPDQVKMGIEVEKEHTDNPMVAVEIATDHLEEIPDYYTRLKKMEDDAKANGEELPKGEDDEVVTDRLLGYQPKNVGDTMDEEIGFEDYKGTMGDKYADAEGNEFAVSNKVKGGVSLKGQGGEKEVATGDLDLMKKLSEAKEDELKERDPAAWHQIQIAKKTLKMPDAMVGVMGGPSKEEAKAILAKYGIEPIEEAAGGTKTKAFKIGEYAVGGIIQVNIIGGIIQIKALDWNTKQPVASRQLPLTATNTIEEYLNELTSYYYAEKVMEWITANS
jgi:hypothetical protein